MNPRRSSTIGRKVSGTILDDEVQLLVDSVGDHLAK
jgi:hypothetical protein